MNTRLEKLVVILLGIIAASLLIIAGCLLYVALYWNCPCATQKPTTPVLVVVVMQQCPPCPQQPTVAPKTSLHKHKVHKAMPKKSVVVVVKTEPVPTPQPAPTASPLPEAPKPLMIAPEPPAVVEAKPIPTPQPAPVVMSPPKETPVSDWIDCHTPQPLRQSTCQPTEEQIQNFLDLGKTNLTLPEVMADEGLKDLICHQFFSPQLRR